jgi:hypothetical protein
MWKNYLAVNCHLSAQSEILYCNLLEATGWTTEGSEFESWWGEEFSFLQIVQTDSEVHPTSYPMSIAGSFPGGKVAGA